ncbi:MAG: hypothetical protein GY929_15505 [Actinomycetia bacterium]|nr:hypothetical protein [Actinomycetes bacterium]
MAPELLAPAPAPTTIRLGRLLHDHRQAHRWSLDRLAAMCGLTSRELAEMEAGLLEPDDIQMALVMEAYQAVPRWASGLPVGVKIDLDSEVVRLADAQDLTPTALGDVILAGYLHLANRGRGADMGSELAVRELDLGVLRRALALRRCEVKALVAESVLRTAAANSAPPRPHPGPASRTAIATGCMAVTIGLAAMLALTASRASSSPVTPEQAPPLVQPTLVPPVVVTRAAAPGPESTAPSAPLSDGAMVEQPDLWLPRSTTLTSTTVPVLIDGLPEGVGLIPPATIFADPTPGP